MTEIDDGDHVLGDDDVLAELRGIGSRIPPVDPSWEEPPAGLWERIAAQSGVDPATRPSEHDPTDGDAPGSSLAGTLQAPHGGEAPGIDTGPDGLALPWPAATEPDLSGPSGPSGEPGRRPGTVDGPIPLHQPSGGRPQRQRGRFESSGARFLAAAAVIAVLLAGAAVIASVVTSDDVAEEVLAASDLDALTDRGSGRAELVDHNGSLELRVDVADLDPSDGFLEVWMIDPDVTRLVSLGPVRADGTYALPAGMDPSAFPIVDVSVEPIDGDPTHSGASVLRGQLEI